MPETARTNQVATLSTTVENLADVDRQVLTALLVKLTMAAARSEGFWSGEILPPKLATESAWKLIQRFRTPEQATAWQEAPVRQRLINELTTITKMPSLTVLDEILPGSDAEVATAIVTDVKPGMEEQYFAWQAKIQEAQAACAGYRGVYLQPPAPGRKGQWSTLLRFDSAEALEKWFTSPRRQELLLEANNFVNATHFQKVNSSFPGWFPADDTTGQPPPNWKTSMLVLLGLFPVALLELRYTTPLMSTLDDSLMRFINLVGSVIATTWVTMPLFIKCFGWWLFPKKDSPRHTSALGVLLLIGLFALEIFIFSHLPARK